MGIYKIIKIIFIVGISICLASCNNVSKQEYDELNAEYLQLKESSKQTDVDVVRQYKNVNDILQQLEGISGKIVVARQNIEGAKLSDIELIRKHISSITDELAIARKKTNRKDNPELYKTIEHLQNIITEKQKEIILLKSEIEKKDQEIKYRGEVIDKQKETIKKQDEDIDKKAETIKKQDEDILLLQKQTWYNMGAELYAVYKEYNDISGGLFNGKNKKRMEANKRNVLLKAKKCFLESENLGHPDAQNQIDIIDMELK